MIHITNISDNSKIEIVPITKSKSDKIIGYGTWLSQGLEKNPTEYYIGYNELSEYIEALELTRNKIKDLMGHKKISDLEMFNQIFKNTEFENSVFNDKTGPWFRWDFPSCDSKEQSNEYYDLIDRLKELNVKILDPCIEHDCISGDILLIN